MQYINIHQKATKVVNSFLDVVVVQRAMVHWLARFTKRFDHTSYGTENKGMLETVNQKISWANIKKNI